MKEVFNEKRKIYVDHQGEHLLRSATNTTSINGTHLKYRTREQYKARIKEEKRLDAEEKRQEMLRRQEEERIAKMLEEIREEERSKKE